MPHESFQPFVLFGRSHQVVLALTVLLPIALSVAARFMHSQLFERAIRWTLAVAILGAWTFWYIIASGYGWLDAGNALPMDLCSWAAIATVVTLIWPNQKSYELAYFWALAGTTQGLMTPGVPYDFPEPRFLEFSVFHGGIIVAVLFLTIGMRMRPYPASIPRIVGWSVVYLAAAGLVDWSLRVNYGFLRAKPSHASLYDLMPSWPWYLLDVVGIALLSVLVCYAPFFIADQLLRRPAT
ncbi:MAG: TIGR02206 family membrane protein [Alphaproteobacteria bacterium]|nr:TIGR02206 family membrane protein [Alphaproteobacteria bacterium]